MNIAVQGCFHGNCDEIFGTVTYIQKTKNIQIDLLLVCGDFQAMRNEYDMNTMACPPKYLEMGTFYKYYTGEKVAPCLTIVIGGNHEASSHLRELYFGGWLAPNIYFLGYSGCVTVSKGDTQLRIGGISGIYSVPSFNNSRMDFYPFDDRGKYSVYHQKQYDILKWLLYSPQKLDIFLSHDWPQGIYHHGNKKELLQKKKHFAKDIQKNQMGSPPLKQLLNHLQPSFWFAAHMHVKFSAQYKHKDSTKTTQFLALDKCQPGREFLQLLHITKEGKHEQSRIQGFKDQQPVIISFDEEWLSIMKATYLYMTIWAKMPKFFIWNEALKVYQSTNQEKFDQLQTQKEIAKQQVQASKIPSNFVITVEPYGRGNSGPIDIDEIVMNPQTKQLLHLIGETGLDLNNFVYYDPRQRRNEMQEQLQNLEGGQQQPSLGQETEERQLPQLYQYSFQGNEGRDDRSQERSDSGSDESDSQEAVNKKAQMFKGMDLPFMEKSTKQ